jgi:hypothetical protein
MAARAERHENQAARTTTTLGATPRPGRTPQQIEAEAKAAAERDRQRKAQQQQQPPAQQQQQLVPVTPAPPPTAANPAALERHLADWSGPVGRLIAFNGSTGLHRTLDDDVEVLAGSKFIACLDQAAKGYIRFNDGAPPTLAMVRIGEDADIPEREALGDTDPRQWPTSTLNGQPDDPWKLQIVFPLVSCDVSGEIYAYVARGPVALNAAGDLLGRFRFHPKRHKGLLPVVEINSGTYVSKKFGPRPKPVLKITDWVQPDGSPAPSNAPPPSQLPPKSGGGTADFNDSLPDNL